MLKLGGGTCQQNQQVGIKAHSHTKGIMAVMVEPQMLRQIAMVAAIVAVVAALAGIVNYGWIAILAELFCAAVISLAAHTGVKFGPYFGTSLSFNHCLHEHRTSSWTMHRSLFCAILHGRVYRSGAGIWRFLHVAFVRVVPVPVTKV